jgi:hypothetical protein
MIDAPRRPIRRILPTLAGDVLALLVVMSVGIVNHHGLEGLLDVVDVTETVAPFLAAWLVIAPLVGAYGERAGQDRWQSVGRGVGAAIGAAVLGSAIRATPVFPGGATLEFVAVIAATGSLGIAIWRLAYHELTT